MRCSLRSLEEIWAGEVDLAEALVGILAGSVVALVEMGHSSHFRSTINTQLYNYFMSFIIYFLYVKKSFWNKKKNK